MSAQTVKIDLNLPVKQLRALSKLPDGTAKQHIARALAEFIDHPTFRSPRFWIGERNTITVSIPAELDAVLQTKHPRISYQDILSHYLVRHRPRRSYVRRVVAEAG